MKARTGIVDGIPCASMVEVRARVGCKRGAVDTYSANHGLEFDYNGHHVILSSPLPYRKREEPETFNVSGAPARDAPRGPVDFTARAMADRKRYDEHGVARAPLLNRRPA